MAKNKTKLYPFTAPPLKVKGQLVQTNVQNFSNFFGNNVIYLYECSYLIQSEWLLISKSAKTIHRLDKDSRFGFILGKQRQRQIKIEIVSQTEAGEKWKAIFKRCQKLSEEDFFSLTMAEELAKAIDKDIIDNLKKLSNKNQVLDKLKKLNKKS